MELRGAEAQAWDWLRTVSDHVEYVGDGEGPPDFVIDYGGVEVAVEVTRMLDGDGWRRDKRIGFERSLRNAVQTVREEPGRPRWHVFCEYDPREPHPPPPRGPWVEAVKDELRNATRDGQLQLVPSDRRVGRGVVVKYLAAGNDGSFSGVSEDIGHYVAGTALTRIAACVGEKAAKVKRGQRAAAFSHWWLVLLEEVVIDHRGLGEEWSVVKDGVRSSEGIYRWDKVIMLSRYTGENTVVHERSGGREGADLPQSRHGRV